MGDDLQLPKRADGAAEPLHRMLTWAPLLDEGEAHLEVSFQDSPRDENASSELTMPVSSV